MNPVKLNSKDVLQMVPIVLLCNLVNNILILSPAILLQELMGNAFFRILVVELSNVLTLKMEPITLYVKVTIQLAFLMEHSAYPKRIVRSIQIIWLALSKDQMDNVLGMDLIVI